jgi:hypothetical protein
MNDKMHEGGLDIALQVIGNLEKKDTPEIQPGLNKTNLYPLKL